MNLVDSRGWLEYFADGPNASFFASPIIAVGKLIVPTICVLEVFKVVLRQRGEDAALQAVVLMRQGKIVELDASLSLSAARIGVEKKIALADSIVVATARKHHAVIWTQDTDFNGESNVKFTPRRPPKTSPPPP